jgi:hypothetical protein
MPISGLSCSTDRRADLDLEKDWSASMSFSFVDELILAAWVICRVENNMHKKHI